MGRIRVTGGGARLASCANKSGRVRMHAGGTGYPGGVHDGAPAARDQVSIPRSSAASANNARSSEYIPFREEEHSAYRDIYESQYIPISHHLRLRK